MRNTVTALAATAMFALFSLPAFAQESPESPEPTAAPSRTATTQIVPPSQPNYNDLISAMNRTGTVTQRLRTMANLTTNDFHFVKVQSIATGDSAGLAAAIARNQAQLATLRRTLGPMKVTATTDNSVITVAQFLADNRMSVNSVVAADIASGKITLFVQ